MSTSLHQEITFNAAKEEVFAAYVIADRHSAFTGAPAKITAQAGEPFSVHSGQIEGCNIEVVPGERIVQAWRAANWPEGNYSLVKLSFSEQDGQCLLTLDHTACAKEAVGHLDGGWYKMYWQPLRLWLEKNN